MNAVVRMHYPVSRLPADLREGLDASGWVRIEITPEQRPDRKNRLVDFVGSGPNVHGDEEDVLARVRSLREDR